jgi:hypothetical protein
MLPLLFDKLSRQLQANEQPEAFLTAWRLLHRIMRTFYVQKLNLPEVAARASTAYGGVDKAASHIDRANESDLFTKVPLCVIGYGLSPVLSHAAPAAWASYRLAAREARHFYAHGKVFGTDRGKSLRELTGSILELMTCLKMHFRCDAEYQCVMLGVPLPPNVEYNYDSGTRRVTISPRFGMNPPPYDEDVRPRQ